MERKTSKSNIILFVLAVVCLIAGIGLLIGQRYCSNKTQGIENSNIVTGAQNTCIAYDSANEILVVGNHNNEAVAFQNGTEVWRVSANGGYKAFVIDADQGIVYAGNEDNHIYIYNISDGSLVSDINAQRRIVAMDVAKDGKIAVATSTGSSKANVLLYDKDGNELLNQKSKIKINGVEFTDDGENVIIGNNRGELVKLDLNGQELGKYETNYTVLQMIPYGENHMVVCKNGGYFAFDDDLNIIRQGVITNTAQAVVSSVGTDANHIETSNPKVNRLFLNALWGQKGNFVDTPTDCPQRDERMGWTGDAQVFCATASFNMYTPAFYHKFLYDMAEEQKELGGSVPHVVPDILDQINDVLEDPIRAAQLGIKTSQESNGSGVAHADRAENGEEKNAANETALNEAVETEKETSEALEKETAEKEPERAAGSCAWGDAATVIPWTSYVFFGDKTLLKKEYENMKMWTDYIHRIDEEKCGGKRLWTYGFHFADWLALDNFHKDSCLGGTDPYYVASCYYLYSAELTAKAAATLGKGEDAIYYTRLAEEVREAIRKEYFTVTGRIAIDTQTAMVLALRFGIVPENARERLIQSLKTKLEEEKIHLTTGFVGTPYLCPVLTENGLADYAYTLLLNEDFPSWLYEVNMGATTIWERWNSVLPDGSISDTGMNSLNHYSYGSIVEWMYRYMCGINPDEHEAGFQKFVIKPYPDIRFEYAKADYQSVYGRIESGWKKTDKGWQFQIMVPFDTTAQFVLEEKLQKEFGKNVSVEAAGGKAAPRAEEELKNSGQAVLEPGSYVIRVEI